MLPFLQTLCLIACCLSSMKEASLLQLLSREGEITIAPIVWAQTRRQLTSFIKSRLEQEIVWTFAHGAIFQVYRYQLSVLKINFYLPLS